MNKQNIINEFDKEEYCECIYKDHILKAKELIISCRSYACILKAKLPISCYTNFRDALFHFYKMYICVTDVDVYNQAFAINEHLSRAQTDAFNTIMNLFSCTIEAMLKNGRNKFHDELRGYLHYFKSYQLKKRVKGMMIFDKNISLLDTSFDEALNKISSFLDYIQKNELEKEMKESIQHKDEGINYIEEPSIPLL